MDLPAVIARDPDLALIDELAHTNAPGVEHEKRYEDIRDVLDAGIDVYSTVNVQHLESLNDQVAEVTGIRVRETVPDSVLERGRRGRADGPDAGGADPASARRQDLQARAHRGGAQQLLQDREPGGAARGRAAPGRPGRREPSGSCTRRCRRRATSGWSRPSVPQAVNERLLALVEPYPGSQRLVRRAWRSAQRLGAELDLLWVQAAAARRSTPDQERSLAALRELASVLGANLLVEESDDVPATIARVGEERGTTYVMMGQARNAAGPGSTSQTAAAAHHGGAARSRRARRRRSISRHQRGAFVSGRDRGDRRAADRSRDRLVAAAARARCRAGRAARRRCARFCFPFTIFGDLGPRARGGDAAGAGRERDPDAGLPVDGAAAPAGRCADGQAVLGRDAGARRDRAARRARGRRGRLAREPRAHRARRAAQAARGQEEFDRVVVPAAAQGQSGFKEDDVAWLLEHVPAEVVILRPGPEDRRSGRQPAGEPAPRRHRPSTAAPVPRAACDFMPSSLARR